MFMIATLILPTCGKRITKTLIEPQSSLDSHASQPAKKGKETWKDYFTKDWTARKVLTVGTAGLVITLAMGYTIKTAIKTACTSYKSYRARKELEAALAFQEEMIEGMIKEEPTQQELEAFKKHHNDEAPKSNSNLRLNGEHTAGDYIFCKDNKWYEVRDQE